MKKQYRIHWINKTTDETGQEDKLYPYGEASQIVAMRNKERSRRRYFVLKDKDGDLEMEHKAEGSL